MTGGAPHHPGPPRRPGPAGTDPLPRSLDRSRLGDGPLTALTPEELAELERAPLGVLGIGLA
jgi:hypothetical protein